jgi:transketolase
MTKETSSPLKEMANAIRFLGIDAVQKANSGHPGMVMGMADIATVLWHYFLKHNPKDPNWINRDRFILSNGHGAMLQYALLHLTGYDVSIEDIKQFRQLDSKTPGHPEITHTPGVNATTGPLGQGLADGVGMALAESILAAQFNQANHSIIDHYTYVFAGDGCMMEGISHEACSLAGTLKLDKLIVFYDDNGISIDGEVKGWFTDDTPKRFEAYHWHVISKVDGHDTQAIYEAILEAQKSDKPSLICCQTQIGFGSPNKVCTKDIHGAPLGEEEIMATRKKLNWPHPAFEIPASLYSAWSTREKGEKKQKEWQEKVKLYQANYPEKWDELERRLSQILPETFSEKSQAFIQEQQAKNLSVATRKASEITLNAYLPLLSELVGGSADLTGSNNTKAESAKTISVNHFDGNYIYYGVREFGMFAIMNGMALHGGIIPYGGTFLVFSDYGRNAIRLAAMMQQKVIFVLTHDSIGLGEDGPTHQPIEHAAMLRMTPGLEVWRPCDGVETAVAWQVALESEKPSCLLLTRQTVPGISRHKESLNYIQQGGYILEEPEKAIEGILIATGSEVSLALEAAKQLKEKGFAIRVVSMPSTTLFDQQNKAYRESVLPSSIKARVAIEAAAKDFWYKYVGLEGKIVGLDQFGRSAPYNDIYKALDITVNHIVNSMLELISGEQL